MFDAVAVMKQFNMNLTPAVQMAPESQTTAKIWRNKRPTNQFSMKHEIMNTQNFVARKQ